MKRLAVLLAVLIVSVAFAANAFDPIEQYEVRQVRGWTVRINKTLLENEPDTAAQALELLDHQLAEMLRRLPEHTHDKLRAVEVWMEREDKHKNHPCMCYHPSADWLESNGYHPLKARCVEVANAATFLDWTISQPYMVMHEFAHAYHHRHFGYDNARIAAVYEKAKASGKYEKVLHHSGREVRHYALNNPMEYFAELTESYFGANDYYPFVRAELKTFDPEGYALIEEIWFGKKGKIEE